jgi:replicative DNA helicase Mcm
MAEFKDVIRLFRKLSETEQDKLVLTSKFTKDANIERLVKLKKIKIQTVQPDSSFIPTPEYPILTTITKEDNIKEKVNKLNKQISEEVQQEIFNTFSKNASELLPRLIAPEIVGFDIVKKAVAIQLFSKERIHILLLGDPGTGKTKILNAVSALHPISAMGLGSGTSGVGLAVTLKGNEVLKGLLPMADLGLCAIDELNLMKDDSRASLYNAMESGFVSYDKGGKHHKFNARVSILATANPKGDRFKGTNPEQLNKQLPFDPALLSRFHLTFLIRRPDVDEFKKISRSIFSRKKQKLSSETIEFIKKYVQHANQLKEPELPKRFEQEVVDFIAQIKQNEDEHLIEVSPRLVVGFIRMAKGLARSELRSKVEEKDIATVKDILEHSLKIR